MRRRPLMWFLLSVLCFIAAGYFWALGDRWATRKAAAPPVASTNPAAAAVVASKPLVSNQSGAFHLLTRPRDLSPRAPGNLTPKTRTAHRLSNTSEPLRQFVRNPKAIVLKNALLDTTRPTHLEMPESLRAHGDPGAYIVQARGDSTPAFRALISRPAAPLWPMSPTTPCWCAAPASPFNNLRPTP